MNILGNQVSPAQSVRNLGVVLDSNFSFSDHVSQVIKSTRVHARDLYRIRPLLDLNTSVLLANALVSSRLDYYNSLFLSLTDFQLRRLQLVQNSLCRVVTRSLKYSHFTPQLKKLHWLPIKYRIQFKIGLITYKILNQGQPVYLRELIHPYTYSRNTRRSTPKLKFLHTPTFDRKVHKSVKLFSNSFSHYIPVLWNSFPFQIRNSPSVTSFRKHPKPTSLILVSQLSFLPSWSHPQPRIIDLERSLTFLMIMILLSQRTEFPFMGKILRLQSSRLD